MKKNYSSILILVFIFIVQQSFSQQKSIIGTVSDDAGPLPGATVLIQGTNVGTQTDFDGNFTLEARPTDILVVSFIGYAQQTLPVGAQSSFSIILSADSTLDEVVVVGYKAVKRSNVTSAVATVDADKLTSVPLATFDQILQGRLPGVEISSGSGQPGGNNARVRVRGSSSISGNNTPLYVVDGIVIDPNSFNSLNSNDFESVTVLKDALATAQYGARGATGVILVETKKGTNQGGKTTLNFRTFSGISQAPTLNTPVLNARQFLEISRDLGLNGAGGLSDADINNQVDALGGINPTDALTRLGRTSSYELSARGGTQSVNHFSSISYFEQEGTIPNSALQRITARVNLGFKVNEKLTIGLNNFLGFSRLNDVPSDGGVNLANPFLIPFIGNPTVPTFNDDGSFNVGNPTLSRLAPNILEDIETGIRENEEFKLIFSANAQYDFTNYLNVRYNVGIDFEDNFRVNAFNPGSFRGQTVATPNNPALNLFGSQEELNNRDINLTSTLSLNFLKTFALKHTISASAFFEINDRHFRSSNFEGFGLEPTLFGFADAITQGNGENELFADVNGFVVRQNLVSVFGLFDYDYDNRFGIEGSLRRDQSSRVAPENSSILFGGVGARWNLQNENFLKESDWITVLKLRASWGQTGNNDFPVFNNFIQQLSNAPLFNGQPQLVTAGLANTNAQWEFTEQINFGLDFSLWRGKLSGTFDYYEKDTDNLFVQQNLPAAFGDQNGVFVNTGELKNNGVEVGLSWYPINTNNWSLNIFGNAAYNFSEIVSLGDQITEFEQGTSIIRVGEQLGSHFVVEYAGVNPSNGEPLYRDLDGNITNVFNAANAKTGFGSSEPLYTGGFGFDLGYRGFSLSTLFAFQAEVDRFNNTTFFLENFNFLGSGLNQSTAILDYFQEPGDITDIPAPFVNGQPTQRQFSSQDIEDASFLRLRDITLAYTLNQKLLKNTFLESAQIYARGVNLLTFTKFSGLDPEDDNNISSFEFPQAKQYTFGIDLTF